MSDSPSVPHGTNSQSHSSLNVQPEALWQSLRTIGFHLRQIPGQLFVLLAVLFWISKTGFAWFGTGLVASSAQAWPEPNDYSSSGLLSTLMYRYITPDTLSFSIVSIGSAVLLVLVPTIVIWRRKPGTGLWRLALILMLCSPAVSVNAYFLGHYQLFLPAMLAMAVLARRRRFILVFVLLAALANPEQATVAFTCLLVLSFATTFNKWRFTATVGLLIGLIFTIAGQLWIASSQSLSRAEFVIANYDYGLIENIKFGALGIYSWWGPLWLLILLLFISLQGRKAKALLLLASVIIPAASTVTSADGTRVFVGVAMATGMALILTYVDHSVPIDRTVDTKPTVNETSSRLLDSHLTIWAVALLLLPMPVTLPGLTGWYQPWSLAVDLILNPPAF